VTSPFAAAKGAFVVEAGTGRQALSLGFEPSAVIFWWGETAAEGVARGNSGGLGFCAAQQAAASWVSADGVTPTQTASCADEVALLGIDPAGAISIRGDVALAPDGFAVAWSPSPSSAWTVHYLALGGSDLAAAVDWLESPRASGRQLVRGLGFEPQLLLLAPTGAETLGRPQRGLIAGIGAASRRAQAGASYVSRDGANEGEVGGAQRSDAVLVATADRAELAALGRLRSFAPGGFEVDWSVVWPTPHRVPYLAIGGVRCKVGTARGPVSPGTKRVRVGFRPEALLLFTWGLSPRNEPTDIGRLCIGGATAEALGCVSWDDRDVPATTTSTHVCSSTRDVLLVTNTQTGGIHAAASTASFDRRGFTLDWGDSDGHERELAYVALAGR
jgi:hypothetical protein